MHMNMRSEVAWWNRVLKARLGSFMSNLWNGVLTKKLAASSLPIINLFPDETICLDGIGICKSAQRVVEFDTCSYQLVS